MSQILLSTPQQALDALQALTDRQCRHLNHALYLLKAEQQALSAGNTEDARACAHLAPLELSRAAECAANWQQQHTLLCQLRTQPQPQPQPQPQQQAAEHAPHIVASFAPDRFTQEFFNSSTRGQMHGQILDESGYGSGLTIGELHQPIGPASVGNGGC